MNSHSCGAGGIGHKRMRATPHAAVAERNHNGRTRREPVHPLGDGYGTPVFFPQGREETALGFRLVRHGRLDHESVGIERATLRTA